MSYHSITVAVTISQSGQATGVSDQLELEFGIGIRITIFARCNYYNYIHIICRYLSLDGRNCSFGLIIGCVIYGNQLCKSGLIGD
jgi:hypothetical protein